MYGEEPGRADTVGVAVMTEAVSGRQPRIEVRGGNSSVVYFGAWRLHASQSGVPTPLPASPHSLTHDPNCSPSGVPGVPSGLGRRYFSVPAGLGGQVAVDETSVILLHPPLPLVGVSIVMERERQQNDSLVNG